MRVNDRKQLGRDAANHDEEADAHEQGRRAEAAEALLSPRSKLGPENPRDDQDDSGAAQRADQAEDHLERRPRELRQQAAAAVTEASSCCGGGGPAVGLSSCSIALSRPPPIARPPSSPRRLAPIAPKPRLRDEERCATPDGTLDQQEVARDGRGLGGLVGERV